MVSSRCRLNLSAGGFGQTIAYTAQNGHQRPSPRYQGKEPRGGDIPQVRHDEVYE